MSKCGGHTLLRTVFMEEIEEGKGVGGVWPLMKMK